MANILSNDKVHLLYRIDIGFSKERGYAAAITDVAGERQRGIKANSIRQLCRRLHEVICEDDQKKRRFPLEHERSHIITPNGFL